jgi:hypothetical protein
MRRSRSTRLEQGSSVCRTLWSVPSTKENCCGWYIVDHYYLTRNLIYYITKSYPMNCSVEQKTKSYSMNCSVELKTKSYPMNCSGELIVTIAILEIEKDMSDNLNSYQSRKITLYRILVVFYLQISLLRGNSVTIP